MLSHNKLIWRRAFNIRTISTSRTYANLTNLARVFSKYTTSYLNEYIRKRNELKDYEAIEQKRQDFVKMLQVAALTNEELKEFILKDSKETKKVLNDSHFTRATLKSNELSSSFKDILSLNTNISGEIPIAEESVKPLDDVLSHFPTFNKKLRSLTTLFDYYDSSEFSVSLNYINFFQLKLQIEEEVSHIRDDNREFDHTEKEESIIRFKKSVREMVDNQEKLFNRRREISGIKIPPIGLVELMSPDGDVLFLGYLDVSIGSSKGGNVHYAGFYDFVSDECSPSPLREFNSKQENLGKFKEMKEALKEAHSKGVCNVRFFNYVDINGKVKIVSSTTKLIDNNEDPEKYNVENDERELLLIKTAFGIEDVCKE